MKNAFCTLATIGFLAAIVSPAAANLDHDGMDHEKMNHGAMDGHDASCGLPMGEGVVNAVDVKDSTINITHKPIAALDWPEMTMDFAIMKPVDLSAFATGENVHFLLKDGKKKSHAIAAMCSLDVDDGAHKACMGQMHKVAMKAAEEAGQSCAMDKMEHGGHGGDGHENHGEMEHSSKSPKENQDSHH